MSHLKERKHRNCLNCNAQVYGKYCHICGQENIEPEETVWHLVTHFFNDITHFDGKFFSTTKLLVFKPGFLSAEYKMGRRAAYLNPVRMYIFTSFIFFLVFFSVIKFNESDFDDDNTASPFEAILKQDSSTIANVEREVAGMDSASFSLYSRAINNGHPIPKGEFSRKLDSSKGRPYPVSADAMRAITRMDSVQKQTMRSFLRQMDSATFSSFTRSLNEGKAMSREEFYNFHDSAHSNKRFRFRNKFSSRTEYDSLTRIGQVKDGWLLQTITAKSFEISEKYSDNSGKMFSNLFTIALHYFPQMLFISLPLFALFLKLIYYRHKDFYFVSHGINSIHLYIFYFIALLFIIGIQKLTSYFNWDWFSTASTILFFALLYYEYRAMRNFYGQGRAKTVVKFLLATGFRFFLITILFLVFLFFSLLKV